MLQNILMINRKENKRLKKPVISRHINSGGTNLQENLINIILIVVTSFAPQ